MSLGSRLLVGALACCALTPLASATASTGETRQSAKALFTEKRAGSSTGMELSIDYVNPADPAAKPPAVRVVELTLARGAIIDTGAVPSCAAGDLELMLFGPSGCTESIVGGGSLRLDTGMPQPVRSLENEVTLLNAAGDLVFLFRNRQTGVRLASHSPITDGRTITSRAPFLPGTPPDGAAVDTVAETIERIAGPAYIRTPPRCPRSRRWVNRWTFTYADGVEQTVRSRSRCRRR